MYHARKTVFDPIRGGQREEVVCGTVLSPGPAEWADIFLFRDPAPTVVARGVQPVRGSRRTMATLLPATKPYRNAPTGSKPCSRTARAIRSWPSSAPV